MGLFMVPHFDDTLEELRASVTWNVIWIVNLLVAIQATIIVECLRTYATLVWLISGMDQYVRIEILFANKLQACRTLQFLFDAIMLYFLVICQPMRTFENFRAHITKCFCGSLFVLPCFMMVHAARVVERFWADITLVRFLICVNDFVLF